MDCSPELFVISLNSYKLSTLHISIPQLSYSLIAFNFSAAQKLPYDFKDLFSESYVRKKTTEFDVMKHGNESDE